MNNLLVEIAVSKLGLHESPIGSNRGEDLKEFFEADDYEPNGKDEGYPWCASFVSRCVQIWTRRMMTDYGGLPPTFKAPRICRAFDLEPWGHRNGCGIDLRPLEPGDIVVFPWSHCGIIEKIRDHGTGVDYIEGNANDKGEREGYCVARIPRLTQNLKATIRLPEAKS